MDNEEIQPNVDQKKRKVKNAFTEEEDAKLISLVNEYGANDWHTVVRYMPGRTTRQCRERYKLYLSPDIKSGPWTSEEDTLLHELYAKYGPKWAMFSPYLNNRTPINIKNRHKQILRHVVRQNRKGYKAEITDPLVIGHNNFIEKFREEYIQRLAGMNIPQNQDQIAQNPNPPPLLPNPPE